MDWIRATSPACNCNNSRRIPTREAYSEKSAGTRREATDSNETVENWPGLLTCAADREDHGTTGAYTAWPALAAEALCYIEGNCSCVDPTSCVAACMWAIQTLHSRTALHTLGLHCYGDSRAVCTGRHSKSWPALRPTHTKEPLGKQTPCPNNSLLPSSRTTTSLLSSLQTAGKYKRIVFDRIDTQMSFDSLHSVLCTGSQDDSKHDRVYALRFDVTRMAQVP